MRLVKQLALGVGVASVPALSMAEGTAVTVPDLGIDWSGSVSAITTSCGTAILAGMGLFAAIFVVRTAMRFLKAARNG